MDDRTFKALVKARLHEVQHRLMKKGAEYSPNKDRLENFKLSAASQKCTPSRALLGMVSKHITAMTLTILDEITETQEFWDEKLGDIICYMILLEAIQAEERGALLRIKEDLTSPLGGLK